MFYINPLLSHPERGPITILVPALDITEDILANWPLTLSSPSYVGALGGAWARLWGRQLQ